MLFIVNATAGAGTCKEKFDEVQKILSKHNVSYSAEYTNCSGDATDIAIKHIQSGENFIVAVGGDGTVREVASALINTGTTFGILPFGTGNDFVKPLGIPTGTEAAANNILHGTPTPIDACRVNGQYFVNVAGIGFDVDVLVETERFKDKYKGMMPYLLGVLRSVIHRKKLPMRIICDGNITEGNFILVNIANGSHMGGGMKVAPSAVLNDGLFDVVMIKYVSLLKFITLFPTFIKGMHVKYKKTVTVVRARNVKVQMLNESEMPIQADGEINEVTPATFEVLPCALNIVLPKEQ